MTIDVTSLTHRRADHRWDRVAVSDLVERLTWSTPDRAALVAWDGASSGRAFERVSYGELDRMANQVANGLISAGLGQGDRVVMVSENSVDGYVVKLGVAKAGMVVSCLNPALAQDVVAHLLVELAPRFAFVDAELWGQVADAFAAAGVTPDVTIEIGGDTLGGTTGLADFLGAQPDSEPEVTIHGDDIAEILYTSGTTAMPKGVMLSHTSATLAAHGFALTLTRGVPIESDVVLASFLPLMYHIGSHIFGLSVFAAGGTLVVGRRFDPAAVAASVERERATALWGGSPAMYRALLAEVSERPRDLSTLRLGVYGWAALPPEVLDGLREHAPDWHPVGIFGQTESISCHRFWPDAEGELYRQTSPALNYVGVPSPLLASRIVDAMGQPLHGRPDEPGEAVYRSPVMTAGYYRNQEATEAAFSGGWFHSGDSCVYDRSGKRIMVDRFKDIVKTGGENVSTIRVESVLMQHPQVQKAAVIGVPDEHWGEAVTAVVVPAGPDLDTAELVAFARERLAGFETPKAVILVEALPETVGGKVMKYKLRQEYRGASDPVQ
ncbi:MAG: AMP-binding protein [Marmoricola sp.]|nr:AMP-binding protein [Marmoricola sp.]